jgi:nucleoside-diphosphate-sugar epimerase
MTVLVTGAGGCIGGHLVGRLLQDGHDVRGIDVKELDDWQQLHDGAENVVGDCSDPVDAHKVADGTDETTSPPTWVAWDSSRTTRPSACCPC